MSNNLSAPDRTGDHEPGMGTDGPTSESGGSPLWWLLIFAVGWISSAWWRKRRNRNAPDRGDSAAMDTVQFPLGVPGYGQLDNPADELAPAGNPDPKPDKAQATESLKTRVARRDKRIAMLKRRLKKLNKELKGKRGHRKKIRANSASRETEILKKQLQEKDKIIAALEDIVNENREKWLHHDANEALLRSKIEELSTDLKLAMKLLDKRQRETG